MYSLVLYRVPAYLMQVPYHDCKLTNFESRLRFKTVLLSSQSSVPAVRDKRQNDESRRACAIQMSMLLLFTVNSTCVVNVSAIKNETSFVVVDGVIYNGFRIGLSMCVAMYNDVGIVLLC